MAELHKITRIKNTRSDLQTNLKIRQISIETDHNENLTYKDDDGTYHIVPNISTDLTTAGILFANSAGNIQNDASNLYWDNSTKRLSIGTTTSTEKFNLAGDMMFIGGTNREIYIADGGGNFTIRASNSPGYTGGTLYLIGGTGDSFGDVVIEANAGNVEINGDLVNFDSSAVFASGKTITLVNQIGEFSTDGTLTDDSDSALVTEKAIKTYVDTHVTAQDLDFQGNTGSVGAVDLDSQILTIVGTANQVITASSGQTLTIALMQDLNTTSSPHFANQYIDEYHYHYGDLTTFLRFQTGQINLEANGNTNQLVLDSNGRVGVQTGTPLYDFQIGDTGATIAVGGAPTGNGTGRLLFINSDAVINWKISTNDSVAGALEFTPSTAGGGSIFTTPAMIIASNNTVGIGINPSTGDKLEVAGSTTTTGGIKSGGAATLKTYTYQGTLDATDISNGYITLTVTDVDESKIINMTSVGYDHANIDTYGTSNVASSWYTTPYTISGVSAQVDIGANYAVDDIISLTVIVAQ